MKTRVVIHRDYGLYQVPEEVEVALRERGVEEPVGGYYQLPRHHPVLVEEVDRYLALAAATALVIYEIYGTKYHINEYDGLESIVTPETFIWIDADAHT